VTRAQWAERDRGVAAVGARSFHGSAKSDPHGHLGLLGPEGAGASHGEELAAVADGDVAHLSPRGGLPGRRHDDGIEAVDPPGERPKCHASPRSSGVGVLGGEDRAGRMLLEIDRGHGAGRRPGYAGHEHHRQRQSADPDHEPPVSRRGSSVSTSADAVKVAHVSIRLRRPGPHPGFLSPRPAKMRRHCGQRLLQHLRERNPQNPEIASSASRALSPYPEPRRPRMCAISRYLRYCRPRADVYSPVCAGKRPAIHRAP
jgi:hypothetical protein